MTSGAMALAGTFVVEVGIRQAWPFIGFCDDRGKKAREIRLYIDAPWSIGDTTGDTDSDDKWLMSALQINNCTVSNVLVDPEFNLRIDLFNAPSLTVSGKPAATTAGEPWWVGEISG